MPPALMARYVFSCAESCAHSPRQSRWKVLRCRACLGVHVVPRTAPFFVLADFLLTETYGTLELASMTEIGTTPLIIVTRRPVSSTKQEHHPERLADCGAWKLGGFQGLLIDTIEYRLRIASATASTVPAHGRA